MMMMMKMRDRSGKWFPGGEGKQGRRSPAQNQCLDFEILHLNPNKLGPEETCRPVPADAVPTRHSGRGW